MTFMLYNLRHNPPRHAGPEDQYTFATADECLAAGRRLLDSGAMHPATVFGVHAGAQHPYELLGDDAVFVGTVK